MPSLLRPAVNLKAGTVKQQPPYQCIQLLSEGCATTLFAPIVIDRTADNLDLLLSIQMSSSTPPPLTVKRGADSMCAEAKAACAHAHAVGLRTAAGVDHLRRAMRLAEAADTTSNLEYVDATRTVGSVAIDRNDFPEMLRCADRSLASIRSVYFGQKPAAPEFGVMLGANLAIRARALAASGRTTEAITAFEQAILAYHTVSSPEIATRSNLPSLTIQSMANLAVQYGRAGDFERGHEMLRGAQALCELSPATPGFRVRRFGKVHTSKGILLLEQSSNWEALASLGLAQPLLEEAYKASSLDYAECQALAGCALCRLGNFIPAEAMLNDAIATLETLGPDGSPELADALTYLGDVLCGSSTKKYGHAMGCYQRALAMRRLLLPGDNSTIGDALVRLRDLYARCDALSV